MTGAKRTMVGNSAPKQVHVVGLVFRCVPNHRQMRALGALVEYL